MNPDMASILESIVRGSPLSRSEPIDAQTSQIWTAIQFVQDGLLEVSPTRRGLRGAPSAGAIYPYEIFIVSGTFNSIEVYKLDCARKQCHYMEDNTQKLRACAELGGSIEPGSIHMVFQPNPWMAMRKYGLRGYLYANLDTAHAAVNVLGAALAGRADAYLHFSMMPNHRWKTPEGEFVGDSCVVALRGAPDSGRVAGWTLCRELDAPSIDASDLLRRLEITCLNAIPWRPREFSAWPRSAKLQRMAAGEGASASADHLARLWQAGHSARSSCTGFADRQTPDLEIDEVVSAATTALPLACGGTPSVSVSVYKRRSSDPATFERIVGVCNRQAHLAAATAFVAFHVDADLIVNSKSNTAGVDAMFKAGGAAQLVYLAAAAARIGVCAVGGFDPERWRELLNLGRDRWILYLVALGTPAENGVKLDRGATAYAHGS